MATLDSKKNRALYFFILIFIILAAGIVTTGYFQYRQYEQQYRSQVELQLTAIADLKVGEISRWRRERIGDAETFTTPAFLALVQHFFEKQEDSGAQRLLQAWIHKCQTTYSYESVSLTDTRGVIRMSVPETSPIIAAHLARDVTASLDSGQIVFLDFHCDIPDGHPHMSIMVPIFDDLNGLRPLGLIALSINPATYLYPLIQRWPTFSKTAETLLIRREGNEVVFLNELRFKKNTALNLHISLTNVQQPAVMAALGRTGIVEGLDYRGVPVIADLRPVPDSPWFMVTLMDTAEVYGPMRERLWMIIVLVMAMLTGASAFVGLVWERQRIKYFRDEQAGLQERTWLYDMIVRSLNEIYVFDAITLRFTFVSTGACRNLGCTVEELFTLTPLDIAPGFTEEAFRAMLQPLITGERELLVFEAVHRRRDGSEYPVDVRMHLTRGDSSVFLASVIDLTESKRKEAEQEKLRTQLFQAQKMESIGHLAGGIAHDFNNILAAIIGYANLMQVKMSAADPLYQNVEHILSASERAATLVHSLLAFSRKQTLSVKQVKINDLASGVSKLLGRLLGDDIIFETVFTVRDPMVMADAGQIDQIVFNLATNARDAMPEGGHLTITTDIAAIDDTYIKKHGYGTASDYALITVSDTGAGMDKATQKKIFEPFFTTKEVGKGTGLGLSTAYGIVKQHDGFIDCYSEPGKGTTFKIYLPLLETGTKAEAEQARETTRLMPGGNETILVAEDDASVRKLIKDILSQYGYTVYEAEDGMQAVQVFTEHMQDIDLLLFDVIMPHKNGKDAYREIQNIRQGVPVIFTSGYTADIIHRQAFLDDGVELLLKPVSMAALLQKVREVLDKNRPWKKNNSQGAIGNRQYQNVVSGEPQVKSELLHI